MIRQPDDPGFTAHRTVRKDLAASEIHCYLAGILTGGTILALVWVLSCAVLR